MAAGPPNLNDWYSRQGMQVKGGGLTLAGGGSIKAGQTGYNLGTGFFLGYSGGVPKLSLGSASGNYLTWDGTNLAISGSLILGTTGYVRGGQTAYNTGVGFFLGYSGGAYKLSIGNPAGSYFTWDGSALSVKSTGSVIFDGAFTGSTGAQVSLDVNPSVNSNVGIVTQGKQNGLIAVGGNSVTGGGYGVNGTSYVDGAGVLGRCINAASGAGVAGSTDNATCPGVRAGSYLGTGLALEVNGKMTMGNFTFTWNGYAINAPGGSTTTFLRNDGSWAAPPYPVTLAGSETLTNKTLTTPVINGFSGTGNGTVTGLMDVTVLKTGTYTVATLPAAATYTGGRVAVTDALGPAFTAVVVGGGAVPCPVYSDGTNWRCG